MRMTSLLSPVPTERRKSIKRMRESSSSSSSHPFFPSSSSRSPPSLIEKKKMPLRSRVYKYESVFLVLQCIHNRNLRAGDIVDICASRWPDQWNSTSDIANILGLPHHYPYLFSRAAGRARIEACTIQDLIDAGRHVRADRFSLLIAELMERDSSGHEDVLFNLLPDSSMTQ